MRRLGLGIVAPCLLALVIPLQGGDQKKPDSAPAAKDQKEAYDKMVSAGELEGKLTNWGEGNQKSLTLLVTVKYQVPNLGEIKAISDLKTQLAQVATNANLNALQKQQQLQQTQIEIAKHQANAMSVKEDSKHVELQLADEVKVRLKDPPVTFDDKGNPKKHTQKELKELKGDPKLPGYQADMTNLANEQTVHVYLVAKKKTTSKDKDDKTADNKPVASMIMILAEPKK